MRKILVVTVARSDFSIYLPTLSKLKNDNEIILEIAATGMHLSPTYGNTYRIIEKEGFTTAKIKRPPGIMKVYVPTEMVEKIVVLGSFPTA